MKIAVMNFSGNVGKSTIAKHLLAPRMKNCRVLFVETINEGGDATNIKGKEFKEVLVELALLDDAVVDIGSSNIEEVFKQLKSMADAHEDFDYYVIPTVPSQKQQKDTGKIFLELVELGIDLTKIKLVFNQVERGSNVEKIFGTLIDVVAPFHTPLNAIIHESEVYPMMGTLTMEAAIAEGTDFKAMIAATSDIEEKRKLATLLGLSRLAKGAAKELDVVFAALFASKVAKAA